MIRAQDDAVCWPLFREAFQKWRADNAPRWGAALAYYTIFSLAPLLVIVIAMAGAFFGRDAAEGRVMNEIQGLIGRDGAKFIQDMITSAASRPSTGFLASVGSILALLFGAVGLFGQLQEVLDTVWKVPPASQGGFISAFRHHWMSFLMVLGIGFLLVVSLVISAVISALNAFLAGYLPVSPLILQFLNTGISLAIVTVLFAMIFKVLPNVQIAWRDVWTGAIVTSLLFTLGKYLIGVYLGQSAVSSTYGAAGSLVVVLLWTYYTAQILIYGAEFTYVYAHEKGSCRI